MSVRTPELLSDAHASRTSTGSASVFPLGTESPWGAARDAFVSALVRGVSGKGAVKPKRSKQEMTKLPGLSVS